MSARTGLITVTAILLALLRGRSYKHLHTLTGREYGACYTVLMLLRESINVALFELSRSYIQLRDANARPDRLHGLLPAFLRRSPGARLKMFQISR